MSAVCIVLEDSAKCWRAMMRREALNMRGWRNRNDRFFHETRKWACHYRDLALGAERELRLEKLATLVS